MDDSSKTLIRWRHVLGRFAQQQLPCEGMSAEDLRREQALDYLYGREYRGRGVRGTTERPGAKMGPGGAAPSQLTVPHWLLEVRELFPKETVELIENHALDRYELAELVTDPQVLANLEPNLNLLKMVLMFKGKMQGEVVQVARRIIREITEALKRKIAQEVRPVLWGKLNRFARSPLKVSQNLNWRGTLRENLKHYDSQRRQLIVQDVRFFSRMERRLPWQVILCVDQSGSMVDSVIHSAVMAGILAGLPALKVNLVVFDTAVVDLSEFVEDPVEVLMSVQLGGGTDIGKALRYCDRLVENPHRTILVLVSDFAEGASPKVLLNICRQLKESGVVLLGLAALDQTANPCYDRQMADRLAALGMKIAALTPKQLAEWIAQRIL